MMKDTSSTTSSRDKIFNNLRRLGVYGSVIHTHRSMATFELSPARMIDVLAIPLSLIALSLLAFPYITPLWKDFFSLARPLLELPGDVKMTTPEVLPFYYLDIPSYTMNAAWPTWDILVAGAGIVGVLLALTLLFSDRLIPVGYLLRACCLIQLTALAYFAIASEPFAYHLSAYSGGLLQVGIIMVTLIPLLFAITLYLFRMSLWRKLMISILAMGHLTIFVPLQTLIHVYVVKTCSFVVMPVMFFMFGLMLDILIIIAFYSWGISWVDITKQ